MNLKKEGKDLVQRGVKLGKSFVLTIILLLQLAIQVCILFFTVWITVFTKGKEIADRKTFEISKGSTVPMTLFPRGN